MCNLHVESSITIYTYQEKYLFTLVAILVNGANSSLLNKSFISSLICKLHCLLINVQGDIYIFDGCLACITSIIVLYRVCSCNPYTAGISREQSGDCCGSLAEANEIKSDY